MWTPTEEEKQQLAVNPHIVRASIGRFWIEVTWNADDEFVCKVLLDDSRIPFEELKTKDADAMMAWTFRQMKEAAKRSPIEPTEDKPDVM